MNIKAIFSDETSEYVEPAEPNKGVWVRIRLRTARDDAKKVCLCSGSYSQEMAKLYSDIFFDYYQTRIKLGDDIFRYYFCLESEEDTLYYTKTGVYEEPVTEGRFILIPGFKTPDWAKGAIIYQIYIDRFRRGNSGNDVIDNEYIYIGRQVRHVANWEEYPKDFDVGQFYGGDLQGVWDKLDYLKDLGVEVIYFNPIFVSPSNHKYDTQDYEHIDPHLTNIVSDGGRVLEGDETSNERAQRYIRRTTDIENLKASDRFFAEFVQYAHKKGIKIIIDGVFNHCGSFNKWLDKEGLYKSARSMADYRTGAYQSGAYQNVNSPYREFFSFDGDSNKYEGWWGYDTLPKLNYENSEALVSTMLGIAKKWLSPPYNVDGWRLDVAADLGNSQDFNHYFWRRFREAVKSVNKDAVIIAEHYGDPSSWLDGRQWDSVMNYDGFMEPVSWFLTGMQKHSDASDFGLLGHGPAFFSMLKKAMALPMPSYMTGMNQLSNHDHSRFLTRTNGKVGRVQTLGSRAAQEGIRYSVFRQGVIMQLTMQGAPALYYGDEVGVCGFTDPDNRRTYPWGRENLELLEFYRYVNQIHKKHPALRHGSLIPVLEEMGCIAYGRVYKETKMLVILHTGEEAVEKEIPVWLLGIDDSFRMQRLMYTYEDTYNAGAVTVPVKEGHIRILLRAKAGLIYIAKK